LLIFILKCGLFIFVTLLQNKVKYVKIKKLCGLFIKNLIIFEERNYCRQLSLDYKKGMCREPFLFF